MSIAECKTSLLPLILDFNSERQWEAYLKAIDDEIEFLIEWEKDIKNRHKNKQIMDLVYLKALEYRDENFPESRYEDGDIDIEELYDGITNAYEAGYHKCQKEAKIHWLGLVEDYIKETYISAIGETDYCTDDMIEHFREHFNIK